MSVYVVVHLIQGETKVLGVYTTYEKAYNRLSKYKMEFELNLEEEGENVNLYLAFNYKYTEHGNLKYYSGTDFYYGYEISPTLTKKTIRDKYNYEKITIESKNIE